MLVFYLELSGWSYNQEWLFRGKKCLVGTEIGKTEHISKNSRRRRKYKDLW